MFLCRRNFPSIPNRYFCREETMGDIQWGPLEYLLLTWGVITSLLVILVVYRVTLSSREDDQIFIGRAEDNFAAEQRAIIGKVTQLSRPIFALSLASGILLLATAGVWIYQGLKSF
jgi:hypothetical protein